MSKTLIIGAHGQIGKLLLKKMQQAQQPALAMIRNHEQATELMTYDAEIVVGDLESTLPEDAFAQCDTVVFTAGSGGKTGADKTILVDLWGACRAIYISTQHHIKHFIMISARDAGDPEQGNPTLKHYNVCKHFADQHLIDSGLPYTILRPGRLTNELASGHITTQRPQQKEAQFISREDVASCIIHCLTHDVAMGHIVELYQGEMEVTAALDRALSNKQV